MSVKDKIILITGASDGIGKTVALEFAKKGAKLILLGSNGTKLDAVYDQLSGVEKDYHLSLECDLSLLNDKSAIEIEAAILEHYGRLDGIIHNAATLKKMTPLIDLETNLWEKILKVNLTSEFIITKTLLHLIIKEGNGRVIFTSSNVATQPKAFWGAYAVSKFAVKGMAELFRQELENIHQIKIFNFDPGPSPTSMREIAFPNEDKETLKSLEKLIPCYEWFFSEESNTTNQHYFKFSDFKI